MELRGKKANKSRVWRFVRSLAKAPYSWWTRTVLSWVEAGRHYEREQRATVQGIPGDPRVRVGRHTYGAGPEAFWIWGDDARVEIGGFCSLAPEVRFVVGEHPIHAVSTFAINSAVCPESPPWPHRFKGPIWVGSDVWIGARAMVMAGVRVGHGAVIAAGSVVTRDVAPYSCVAGVPARPIRSRFPPAQVEALLEIAWWDWPDDRLREQIHTFYAGVDAFIDTHRRERTGGPPADVVAAKD